MDKCLEKLSCAQEERHMVGTRGEGAPQQGALSVVCSNEFVWLPCRWKQMRKIMFPGVSKGDGAAQDERILSRIGRKTMEMATKSQA